MEHTMAMLLGGRPKPLTMIVFMNISNDITKIILVTDDENPKQPQCSIGPNPDSPDILKVRLQCHIVDKP
jgi:hypothetical protein